MTMPMKGSVKAFSEKLRFRELRAPDRVGGGPSCWTAEFTYDNYIVEGRGATAREAFDDAVDAAARIAGCTVMLRPLRGAAVGADGSRAGRPEQELIEELVEIREDFVSSAPGTALTELRGWLQRASLNAATEGERSLFAGLDVLLSVLLREK